MTNLQRFLSGSLAHPLVQRQERLLIRKLRFLFGSLLRKGNFIMVRAFFLSQCFWLLILRHLSHHTDWKVEGLHLAIYFFSHIHVLFCLNYQYFLLHGGHCWSLFYGREGFLLSFPIWSESRNVFPLEKWLKETWINLQSQREEIIF